MNICHKYNVYLTPEQKAMPPCVHADEQDLCTAGCAGSLCCHCEEYKPNTRQQAYDSKSADGVAAAPSPSRCDVPAAPSPSQIAPASSAGLAHALNAQYLVVQAKTGELLRESVKFGAMLIEVERFVGCGRGRGNAGEGLKGWLEQNCPEISYKTAYGYKSLAEKACRMLGGNAMALAALQNREAVTAPGTEQEVVIDAEVVEKRERMFAQASSQRQLMQMYFDFMGERAKPGRRPGEVPAQPAVRRTDVENARLACARLKIEADKRTVLHAVAILPPSDAQALLEALKPICRALENRIEEARL